MPLLHAPAPLTVGRASLQVWHHYNRKDNPNVYGDRPEDWWHVQQKSNARARYILNIDNELKPTDTDESEFSYSYYGMGQERTLQQYWDYAGAY